MLNKLFSNKLNQRIVGLLQGLSLSEYFTIGNHLTANRLIGLEISAEFIKFLKIHVSDNRQVENFCVVPLPSGLVVKNEIKDCAAIADILKDNLNTLEVTTKNIVLAVNHSSIITKTITVNSHLIADEIEARVWSEANRLFPNLISDIFLDYAVIGISEEDASQLEILVVACRKEHIKPYLDIMRLADLNLKAIDVNSYALERSLGIIAGQFPEKKTIALLNLGFSLITLIITHENKLIYSHELPYDGHNLFQQVKNKTLTDVEEILRKNLSLHLKHIMQFFYTSRPQIRIEQIILAGDCAAIIPNLIHFIQREIGKETVLSNPFKEMTLASRLNNKMDQEKLAQYAPALMQCCGLALSKLH